MFSPATLRRTAITLLMLPLLHLTWLIATDLQRYLEPSPRTWDPDLDAIIEKDMRGTMPEHPVLVVGGQRVRLWDNLPEVFDQGVVLRRSLGDATLEDLTYHYDRLVAYYQPSVLVVFPGYADLHLRDDKSPEQFVEAARQLIEKDRAYSRDRLRVLLTPLLTPLHPGDAERVAAMTVLARGLGEADGTLLVLDPNRVLQGADGRPDPNYFRIDGINLNPAGYALLTQLLEESLTGRG